MGLAPYGNNDAAMRAMKNKIVESIIDIRDDGSFLLNMDYFDFATGLTMCNDKRWEALFKIPPRKQESEITQEHMNLARAIQEITEEIVLTLAATAKKLTGMENCVLAGGVALNCVANGALLSRGIFKNLWIQPASGDAGGAIGAALGGWHIAKGEKRSVCRPDAMNGSLLGPAYADIDIEKTARHFNARFSKIRDESRLFETAVSHLENGKVIGWFQGRMEFGPRALGNRSILGDSRRPDMQKKMNLSIKFREGFRPFAPAVLEEHVEEYFDLRSPSPYMLFVAKVKESRLSALPQSCETLPLLERLYLCRSDIPAVTHIDFSARIQSVDRAVNPRFWGLLDAFEKKTGYPVLVNTSFNVRGEPIVCTPLDAYRCFMRTDMDVLFIENYCFEKSVQPAWDEKDAWQKVHTLD